MAKESRFGGLAELRQMPEETVAETTTAPPPQRGRPRKDAKLKAKAEPVKRVRRVGSKADWRITTLYLHPDQYRRLAILRAYDLLPDLSQGVFEALEGYLDKAEKKIPK